MRDTKRWNNGGDKKKQRSALAGGRAASVKANSSATTGPRRRKPADGVPVDVDLTGQKRVLEAIASGASLSETLQAITAAVEDRFSDMLCSILLTDETGTRLSCSVADSFPKEYNDAINGMAIGPCAGSCGTAAYRRELVVVENIATDPLWTDFREAALRHDLRACWSRPIVSQAGRLLGTFAMYFREPREPSRPQLEAIESAASLAGIAIEHKRNEEQLKQMNERFQLIAKATNDAVWDWDLTTDGLWWNEGFQSLFGYAPQEIEPGIESWYNRIHPDDRERVISGIHALVQGGDPSWVDEYRFLRRDGSAAYIYDRGFVIRDAQGKAIRMIGAMTDITERRRAEQAMAQHALRQETVAALGQFALGHRDLDDLINRAACAVARGLEIEYCEILEYIADDGCLLPRAYTGRDAPRPRLQKQPADRETLESYCLRVMEPVVVEDFSRETRFVPDTDVRSGVAVVVHGGAHAYGVLSAHSARPRRFSPDEVNFVQSVANVLAAAIERRGAEQQLAQLAQFDLLTGLPNRNLFRDRLARAIARAQRDERLAALLFLDLDQFKEINDTLGHEAGDLVLKEVSARLRDCLREDDTIARLGGDEFTVILEEMSSAAQVEQVANKVLHAFEAPIRVDDKEFFVTPSIGVALYPTHGKDGDSLLKHADIAMYQAKNEGRNNVQFYASTMSAAASDRVSLERSLRQALERQEFLMYYQPIVDLRSGALVSLEALLRWQHPDWGLVAPERFIQLAEQTGLIVPIGEWVLHDVCAQSARWQKAGLPPVRIAVNLSARQFRRSNLVDVIGQALRATGLRGEALELEITESLLMESPEASSRLLEKLKTMGVNVTLDDFGTGYSSFSYLKYFPLDVVKIDRSFVRDITTDPDDAAIVLGMIELAHSLELELTAEGVETREQVEYLRAHNCDYAQGYFFSRPQPADALCEVLRAGRIRDG